MRIIDNSTSEVYYDTGGEKFLVCKEFWQLLKTKGIRYATGGTKHGISYSSFDVLKLGSSNFEEIFGRLARSQLGRDVMLGKLPVDTEL